MGTVRISLRVSIPLLSAGMCACDDENPADTGLPPFEVVGISPEPGAFAESVVYPVQLILSDIPDLERCNANTIRVDALLADGTVGFNVALTFDLQSEGNLKLKPDDPYFRGYTYAVTIRGGNTGCADVNGRAILPFYSTFEVP